MCHFFIKIFSLIIDWVVHNLLNLIVSIGTLLAAYFAYRSAKMSEIANKAQFSPLLIPSNIIYISAGAYIENDQKNKSSFYLTIENRTQFTNAFAKNITISINGDLWWSLETLDSGVSTRPEKKDILKEEILSKELVIAYEDILGNKFETRCILGSELKSRSPIHSESDMIPFDWQYIQK